MVSNNKLKAAGLKGSSGMKGARRMKFGRSWRHSRRRWVLALNSLTAMRILIVPILVLLLLPDENWLSWLTLGIFIPFALSDLLDGYLARRFYMENEVGKFLDPIADKVFVVALVYTVFAFREFHFFAELSGLVIILREVIITGLRGFLASKGVVVDVAAVAKWKTVLQMVALGFAMSPQDILPHFFGLTLTEWLLIATAIFTVGSTYRYVVVAFSYFRKL